MRQALFVLLLLFLTVSAVMADDSSSSDSATTTDDSSSSDSATTTDDSSSSDSATTTDDSSSTSYLEMTTSRVSITAASSESTSSTSGSVSMPGLTTTTTSTTSTSTSSTSSTSTTSFSYTVTIPTSTTENPFITHYTVPEGTVFIAVGSIIGGLLLAASAWRAALWYSMHRSAQKEAPYFEDSKLGLFPIDNNNNSNSNFVAGENGTGGSRPYLEYRGPFASNGEDYPGSGGLYYSSAYAASKSSVDNLPPPNTARVHSGLYYSPILEAATRHGDQGLPFSEVGFSTPVGYHSPALDSVGDVNNPQFAPPLSTFTNKRASRSQRPPSTVLNNVLSDNVPLNPSK